MASVDSSEHSFLRELKRRNVLRYSLYYAVACWLILKAGDFVFSSMGQSGEQASGLLLVAVIIGFPVFLWILWRSPLTPKGMARTTSVVERRVLSNMVPINDRRHAPDTEDPGDEGNAAAYSWVITAETGALTGLRYGVGSSLDIGSAADCDIALVNQNVSPRHVRLWPDGGSLYVEDLGSVTGTAINGRKIQGRHALHDEDEIRLHDVVFRVSEYGPNAPKGSDTISE